MITHSPLQFHRMPKLVHPAACFAAGVLLLVVLAVGAAILLPRAVFAAVLVFSAISLCLGSAFMLNLCRTAMKQQGSFPML